jgi:UDP-GlcNAc:undecaprenyl-phosphate GlcNAc-1-phosphate transferase
LNLLFLPVILLFISLGGGFFMVRVVAPKFNLFDVPGYRSSHKRPTPTMGGLTIVTAFFLGMILVKFLPMHWERPQWFWWFVAGAGLVAVHGLIDDLHAFPPLVRLFLFGIVAGLPVVGGIRLEAFTIPLFGVIELGVLEIPLSLIWIIAIICFYNFMDGIDGLAVGVGVIVTGFLSYIAWEVGNVDVFILSLLLGSSCLGFVWHNFPPAKIFMGDVGSTFVGYTLAILALIGNQSEQNGYIPLLVPILLLGTFLFDTVVTLGRRILRRKKWYLSHREHYYQKMTNLGFSHSQITFGEYGITFCLGFSALLYIQGNQVLALSILLIWLTLFIISATLIALLEKRVIEGKKKKD